MDWRIFIPHALVSGGMFGGLVAVILVPILVRRDTRQRGKEIESVDPTAGKNGGEYQRHGDISVPDTTGVGKPPLLWSDKSEYAKEST